MRFEGGEKREINPPSKYQILTWINVRLQLWNRHQFFHRRKTQSKPQLVTSLAGKDLSFLNHLQMLVTSREASQELHWQKWRLKKPQYNYSSEVPALWQGEASHKHPFQTFANLLLTSLKEMNFHIIVSCLLECFSSKYSTKIYFLVNKANPSLPKGNIKNW